MYYPIKSTIKHFFLYRNTILPKKDISQLLNENELKFGNSSDKENKFPQIEFDFEKILLRICIL